MVEKNNREEEMKNLLFSVIILECLSVARVRGSDFYDSSFSNIVGSLGRTQVTMLVGDSFQSSLGEALSFFSAEGRFYEFTEFLSESPSHSLYIFVKVLRKSVEWKDIHDFYDFFDESNIELSGNVADLTTIIEDEIFVNDTSAKQTLLFFGDVRATFGEAEIVWRALEMFQNKKDRNLIIVTFNKLQVSQLIPYPIIPIEYISKDSLIDLVKNPNYNNVKYIKHVKIEDGRLKCLKNKTIHILATDEPLRGLFMDLNEKPFASLMENIAILVHNLLEFSTKIVYYTDNFDGYEKEFLEYHGITDSKNFNMYRFDDHHYSKNLFQSIESESADVYLVYEQNYNLRGTTDIFRVFHLACRRCVGQGRKHMIYNPASYDESLPNCKNFKVSHFKTYVDRLNSQNLIEEVLSAACF